jgi:hypothetical protein
MNTLRLAVLFVPVLFSSVICFAEQKYTINYSVPPASSRYVKDHSIDVDDVPGHKIRIVEIQRVFKDGPEVMGKKAVESWLRGFTNYVGGQGPARGYDTWTFEDGSKIFFEWDSLTESVATETGSRRGTSHSTSRFVGGTGKFSGIQGMLQSIVEFDSDPKNGYSKPSMRGEYWFVNQ